MKKLLTISFLLCVGCGDSGIAWLQGEWQYDFDASSHRWDEYGDSVGNENHRKIKEMMYKRGGLPNITIGPHSWSHELAGSQIQTPVELMLNDDGTISCFDEANEIRYVLTRTPTGFCLSGTGDPTGNIAQERPLDWPSHPWYVDCYRRPGT